MAGRKRARTKAPKTVRVAVSAMPSGRSLKAGAEPGRARRTNAGFPIVGIGASAGGLESLEQFFGSMPNDTGMAFVVIQHLAPDHVGIMPELLQRITPMKVLQATDGVRIKPNCVYVIPPNKSMSLLKNALHLFDPVEPRGLRLPIDIFLRSLADDRGEESIGVILSGMGSDGSLGLKAIKEKNGTVVVQEPASAKFDGMPRSAIDTVIADIVAPAEQLPSKLISFLKYSPAARPDSPIGTRNKSALDKIIILLREQSGHDFAAYKKTTLIRRIERRKGIHQLDSLQSYVRFLQDNPKETEILFKELLIGVTGFFRDPALWQKLRDKVLPDLMEGLPEGYVLRAWVTGCSTGEEAYSLAIVFKEALERSKRRKSLTLQIFASDLDKDAVARARKGVFPPNIAADVSPERLNRFFTADAEGYRIGGSIREMVVFAPQNVIKDPPFTKLDVLTCRNMLIYMEPELQEKLVSLFHYSLKPGGIMVLGAAETLGKNKKGFNDIDAKLKIYQRTAGSSPQALNGFPGPSHHKNVRRVEKKSAPKIADNIQVLADQLLLNKYVPASVWANDKGDVLYLTGEIGKYLEPVAGKANFNIYAMAREGLRQVLPSAFRHALQTFEPVTVRNIKVGGRGGAQMTDVTIQRVEKPVQIRGMMMVVFRDAPVMVRPEQMKGKKNKPGPSDREKELELELQRCYEDLHTMTEEMQTSQEELQSINEELQSTNEELQSSNEELTTSKEEMQSLNEELQTVNIELQSKVNEYVRANDDMKNLLNSTEIATLFLDKDLNIRRFTEQATKVIKLRSGDIGRPFTDLVSDLQYPEIDIQARQVMKTLTPVETAIAARDDRWFTVRIMPYRTVDDRIDGLVITFVDITTAKKLELGLKKANEALQKNH